MNSSTNNNQNSLEKDERNQGKSKFDFSEGLILAVIPALSYLSAFLYEYGFVRYFGIPAELIVIDFLQVFILAVAIFFTFPIVLLFIQLPYLVLSSFGLREKTDPIFLRSTQPLLWTSLFSLILILITGFQNWRTWSLMVIPLILFGLIYLTIPLLTQRKVGSYIEKLQAQQELDDSIEGFYDYLVKRFGLRVVKMVNIGFLILFFVYWAGYGKAINQTEFPVMNTSPETVVLKIYRDNIISAPINRATKEVENRFFIIKVGEQPNLVLNIEEIGPLKILDKSNNSNLIPVILTPTPSP